jgi:hypothetical protein
MPAKNNALAGGAAQGVTADARFHENDCCAVSLTAAKRFSTLQARAALAGHVLKRSAEDGREVFVASRWAWVREFHTLDEAEAWLDSMAGKESM